MSRRKFLLSGLGITALPSASGNSQESLIPVLNIPRPKFHIGQEVCCFWNDKKSEFQGERGLVVGMRYQSQVDDEEPGWRYFLQWSWVPNCPHIVGTNDGSEWNEDCLEAFDYKGLELQL